jgi:hypothetical protein
MLNVEFIRIIPREHYMYCCLPKKKKQSFALAASPHCNRTAQRRLTSNIGINHVIHHRMGLTKGHDRTGQDRTHATTTLSTFGCTTSAPRLHHIHCRRAQVLHPEAHPQGSTAACYDFVVIFIITIVSVLLVIFIC